MHTLSTDAVALTPGATATTHFSLGDLVPGERGTETFTVRFRGDADAAVALYAAVSPDDGQLARRLHIGIFERSRGLLPFPVFSGTLADLAGRDRFERGIGRWTGRGDGTDREVSYEVSWRLPKEATGLDGRRAEVELTLEAHALAA
ncbi:hypothetical protein J4573_14445 [Actinomadura barringtoniae]|uniref:Uncharacterized protein n=1 Tax=Actinomadura barringtoniae TaxID=1427535 RepID=A0A939P978_9ACTN|nr:hypothetical protein [Actinomadura barringtoniae]MBO2448301.1 hypothetical protein [Actinomadura barringtoniae]